MVEKNSEQVIYKCEWCPCIFFTKHDLDRHLEAFKITGKAPNQYDHKVVWKNAMEYRLKREPYEKDLDGY